MKLIHAQKPQVQNIKNKHFPKFLIFFFNKEFGNPVKGFIFNPFHHNSKCILKGETVGNFFSETKVM